MLDSSKIKHIIEEHEALRQQGSSIKTAKPLLAALDALMQGLNNGSFRAASPTPEGWTVNSWVKQGILLYFATHSNASMEDGLHRYFDKIPLKYSAYHPEDFEQDATRVVPGAVVRNGSFIGRNTVLMPSFINIGAYVDEGCMVDTWATVGSCAQIGKGVHLSGGAGIGGVLEPLQAAPTIIEDHAFIGARSEIVEGVRVGEGAVIAMGVFISQSTPIYHRERDETLYGHVPAGSVVIPGSLPGHNGRYQKQAAIIVKEVDTQTRKKVGINALLREAVA